MNSKKVHKYVCGDCLDQLKKSNAVAVDCPAEETTSSYKCGATTVIDGGKEIKLTEGNCRTAVSHKIIWPQKD